MPLTYKFLSQLNSKWNLPDFLLEKIKIKPESLESSYVIIPLTKEQLDEKGSQQKGGGTINYCTTPIFDWKQFNMCLPEKLFILPLQRAVNITQLNNVTYLFYSEYIYMFLRKHLCFHRKHARKQWTNGAALYKKQTIQIGFGKQRKQFWFS